MYSFNLLKRLDRQKVAFCVGAYDAIVGLFPLLALPAFISLTGLSHHLEIVRALGIAWAGLGFALLVMHRNYQIISILGLCSTIAGTTLALTQIFFVLTGTISPIFLIQTAAELFIGYNWLNVLNPAMSLQELKMNISEQESMLR